MKTEFDTLQESPRFAAARRELLSAIAESSQRLNSVRPAASAEAKEAYTKSLQSFGRQKGRDPYFPYLSSGLGSGPFAELIDGSVKFDLITGIGVNFFGHSHPALMEEMIKAVPSDVMQGNLQPGVEARDLLDALLARVGKNSRLKHGWITTCGTMANENALKIVRQKKAPATQILAFEDCFCGRSTAMAELTDNPGYRQGLPVYGEVHYLPFYSPKLGLEASVEATLGRMRHFLGRYGDKIAALMIEIVQGEGGFNAAPREFYVRVFEEAKKAGLLIWADEIQTFGRTGELFAYQLFGLEEYMDVVTVAKMLQASVVLYTEELNPKPGLVAGTFSGGTAALRAGRRTLELLDEGRFLGPQGRIAALSGRLVGHLKRLAGGPCSGKISDIRHTGGMIAFQPMSGSMADVKQVLTRLFDLGAVAFYCGHGPYLIRMLPPLGAMTEEHVDQVAALIERAFQ